MSTERVCYLLYSKCQPLYGKDAVPNTTYAGQVNRNRISTERYGIKMPSQPVRSTEVVHPEGYARYDLPPPL
jgi:hypothetical protein